MEEKFLVLIDERDQLSELKSINRTLKNKHGIDLSYEQLNPSSNKFQSLDTEEKPYVDLKKIINGLKDIPFFKRSNVIAIDYNLVENQLDGFQVSMMVRELGFKVSKKIIIYSAGIEKAIDSILKGTDFDDQKNKIKSLVNGNISFIKRDDYQSEIVNIIKKEPISDFDFDLELTTWLHKFGDQYFKSVFPDYDGKTLSFIAEQIEQNTDSSIQFRKDLIEQIFSFLINLNELKKN